MSVNKQKYTAADKGPVIHLCNVKETLQLSYSHNAIKEGNKNKKLSAVEWKVF